VDYLAGHRLHSIRPAFGPATALASHSRTILIDGLLVTVSVKPE
jgi:hypothetical protein